MKVRVRGKVRVRVRVGVRVRVKYRLEELEWIRVKDVLYYVSGNRFLLKFAD